MSATSELPEVTSAQVVNIQPGDVIVLSCDHDLDYDEIVVIRRHVQERFPDNELMILVGGIRLAVLSGR